MYWNKCSGCNCVAVSKSQPTMVTSFHYDIKGNRKSRSVQPHYMCPDCKHNSHSWLLNIANKPIELTTTIVRKEQ